MTERHVTEYLANWYLFLWQALGDAIAEVGGLPGSPSAQWRHDQRVAASGGPVSVADYAERSAVQAAEAVRQHVRLLSRAYWPNSRNPGPEDPDDWPARRCTRPRGPRWKDSRWWGGCTDRTWPERTGCTGSPS